MSNSPRHDHVFFLPVAGVRAGDAGSWHIRDAIGKHADVWLDRARAGAG
jgi:hypothetical protein